jgi:hypothetical protein
MFHLVLDELEQAWPIICEVIRGIRHDAEDLLAYVSAGPLEDVLVYHPYTFIDRIEALARNTSIFAERGPGQASLRRCFTG